MKDLYIFFMSRKYKFHDNDKLYFISYVPNTVPAGFSEHKYCSTKNYAETPMQAWSCVIFIRDLIYVKMKGKIIKMQAHRGFR